MTDTDKTLFGEDEIDLNDEEDADDLLAGNSTEDKPNANVPNIDSSEAGQRVMNPTLLSEQSKSPSIDSKLVSCTS